MNTRNWCTQETINTKYYKEDVKENIIYEVKDNINIVLFRKSKLREGLKEIRHKERNNLFLQNKINEMFINYNITNSLDGKYSWPSNVFYVSFNFYIMSSIKQRTNKNIRYIYYYCTNHKKIKN